MVYVLRIIVSSRGRAASPVSTHYQAEACNKTKLASREASLVGEQKSTCKRSLQSTQLSIGCSVAENSPYAQINRCATFRPFIPENRYLSGNQVAGASVLGLEM